MYTGRRGRRRQEWRTANLRGVGPAERAVGAPAAPGHGGSRVNRGRAAGSFAGNGCGFARRLEIRRGLSAARSRESAGATAVYAGRLAGARDSDQTTFARYAAGARGPRVLR